jgi:hypothetical protein
MRGSLSPRRPGDAALRERQAPAQERRPPAAGACYAVNRQHFQRLCRGEASTSRRLRGRKRTFDVRVIGDRWKALLAAANQRRSPDPTADRGPEACRSMTAAHGRLALGVPP